MSIETDYNLEEDIKVKYDLDSKLELSKNSNYQKLFEQLISITKSSITFFEGNFDCNCGPNV